MISSCRVMAVLALIILPFTFTAVAFAQEGAATPEKLQECKHLGIASNECSDATILDARKSLVERENQIDTISLSSVSYGGQYVVDIYWKPNDISQQNDFDVFFYNSTNKDDPIIASYAITIMKGGIPLASSVRADQIYTRQSYTFDEVGSYTIKIDNINGGEEGVQIPIQVTPEFPMVPVAILGLSVASIIVVSRFNHFSAK